MYSVDNDLLVTDIKEDFYTRIYYTQCDLDELKRSYTRFINVISHNYRLYMIPPYSKDIIDRFIDKLAIDAVSENCITKHEVKYFKMYLSILHTSLTDIGFVMQTILAYVYPDLLTSSMTMLS